MNHAAVASGRPVAGRRRLGRARWLLVLVLPVALGSLLLAGPRHGGTAASAPRTVVKRGDLDVVILEAGRIEPKLQAQLRARVGGIVKDVTVDEGATVQAGELLAALEEVDYKRELQRIVADIAEARAYLSRARQVLRRTARLRRLKTSSQEEWESARAEVTIAQARLDAKKVAAEVARDQLRYTKLRAPFAGTIIDRNVNPGEVVVAGVSATMEGRPLLVLADLGTLVVRVHLNQLDVTRVAVGAEASVKADALPEVTWTGTVSRIAPAAIRSDTGAEVFEVEVALPPDAAARVRPGMTADVELRVKRRQNVLLVPVQALVKRGSGYEVMVLGEGEHPTGRPVELGERDDRHVEVRAGLREGEVVATGAAGAG